jgi:hypothetical protein
MTSLRAIYDDEDVSNEAGTTIYGRSGGQACSDIKYFSGRPRNKASMFSIWSSMKELI